MNKWKKSIAVSALSLVMGFSVFGMVGLGFSVAKAEAAVIAPIAKYEFKDKDDLGKDSMGNYDMEYRNLWVSGGAGALLNMYTSVDEVNGGVSFDGEFCLSQDKDSNMFADVSAFTLCFEIKTAKCSGEWAQYIGVGNSNNDGFAFIGRMPSYPGQLRLQTFNMLEWDGTSNIFNAPKVFEYGENNAPMEYEKIVATVQPGGDMLIYRNGALVTLTNPNKGNQAWDTSIDANWATATKNSFFSIGGRYNGAVDKTATGSIRNVQFYDFAMDADCVSAYNTNGQITTEDVKNLAMVTGLNEVVFDGEPTDKILNTAMPVEEMFASLNSANAKFNLSNGSTVSTPITWTAVEKVDDKFYAKGEISATKLGYINTYGTQISYELSVIEIKAISEPVFAGDVLKGEIKDNMSTEEMLALINTATITITFMDDSTQDVEVAFTEIKSVMGKYTAYGKVILNDVLYGTVGVDIDVAVTNEGPTAELKPVAKWSFDSEETKLNDAYEKYTFQAVPKKNGDMSDVWGTGTIDNGSLYLDGESMIALPLLNDISENIDKGFTLNFQYKQDGLYTEEREQKWSVPVSFGAKDFGSSFGAGFIIADNSGDLRIYGHDITKNVTNDKYSFYWTQKVVEGGENAWHNVTLSVRPGQFFNVYVDGVLKYSEVCPADWSLENDSTAFSIGGRVMWNNGYNLFRGWIDNVTIYNFAQDLEQSNAYWEKAKLIVKDMNGEIISSISNEPTFENGEMLNKELFDNLYDAQVKRRVNPATVNALFDNDQTLPLCVEWLGYRRENGVWYIIGQVDTGNLGYATLLTGKVEVKVQAEVTRAPRLISIETANNGVVTTDKSEAYLDDQIVITATPNQGYLVGMVKVNGIAITENENGEYVYTVEGADDLTITVTFKVDPNASTQEPSDETGCGCGSNILNETMLITVLALVATVSCIRRKKDF